MYVCALSGALVLLGAGVAQAKPRWGEYHRSVCAALVGEMRCLAQEATMSAGGSPLASSTPPVGSYGPAQLQGAYSLSAASGSKGAGGTVAIVDAYNEPYIKNDINKYRSQYGIPAISTSGSGSPSFRVVNQTGGAKLPRIDSGWGDEEALDVEMVSAICPNCSIVLVEASSPSIANLDTAERTAQSYQATSYPPVVAVSNSWNGSEFSGEIADDGYYGQHPTTVAAGDSGTGAAWPTTSPNVTAVGGTTLDLTSSNTRASETAWSDGGSGCSAYEKQPSFQVFTGFPTGCSGRAEADVAADADPSTGVAVYDSCGDAYAASFEPAPCAGSYGWQQFGGTSVATPIIASVFALAAGDPKLRSGNLADAFLYTHDSSANFYDVTSGSNGSCSPSWICIAGPGYDGPTGLGTPNGTGGF
jgi:subtilase family serine protease